MDKYVCKCFKLNKLNFYFEMHESYLHQYLKDKLFKNPINLLINSIH